MWIKTHRYLVCMKISNYFFYIFAHKLRAVFASRENLLLYTKDTNIVYLHLCSQYHMYMVRCIHQTSGYADVDLIDYRLEQMVD